jgi:hypothetical protein
LEQGRSLPETLAYNQDTPALTHIRAKPGRKAGQSRRNMRYINWYVTRAVWLPRLMRLPSQPVEHE